VLIIIIYRQLSVVIYYSWRPQKTSLSSICVFGQRLHPARVTTTLTRPSRRHIFCSLFNELRLYYRPRRLLLLSP